MLQGVNIKFSHSQLALLMAGVRAAREQLPSHLLRWGGQALSLWQCGVPPHGTSEVWPLMWVSCTCCWWPDAVRKSHTLLLLTPLHLVKSDSTRNGKQERKSYTFRTLVEIADNSCLSEICSQSHLQGCLQGPDSLNESYPLVSSSISILPVSSSNDFLSWVGIFAFFGGDDGL